MTDAEVKRLRMAAVKAADLVGETEEAMEGMRAALIAYPWFIIAAALLWLLTKMYPEALRLEEEARAAARETYD